MLPEETSVWQACGLLLKEMQQTSPVNVSLLERLQPLVEWASTAKRLAEETKGSPGKELTAVAAEAQKGVSPCPADPIKSDRTDSVQLPGAAARTAQIPVSGRAISLFAVDPTQVKAGVFLSSLTFQRNDPSRQPIEFLQPPTQRPRLETCRQFLAYSIPWEERGGKPPGPESVEPVSMATGFQSLHNLSSAATAQALHLASKMKREHLLVSRYTAEPAHGEANRTADFLGALPWAARRHFPNPESQLQVQT